MSPWRDGRDGLLGRRLVDDATAEELIAGRTAAGADDLGRVSAFLEELRSLGQDPPPPPSAALSKMLAEAPGPRADRWLQLVDNDVVAAREPFAWEGGRPRNGGEPGPAGARRRPSAVVAMAAALALAATAGVTGAAAGLLPGPALQAVARAIETVTPFELRTSDDDADEPMSRRGVPFQPGSPDQAAAPPARPGVPAAPAAPGAPSAGGERGDDRLLQPPAARAGGGDAPRQAPPASGEREDDVAGDPLPTEGATTPASPPPPREGPAPEPAPAPPPGGRAYTALLTGNAGPGAAGDPDGSGSAVVSVHPGRWLVCVTLTTSRIAIPTSVHLHEASAPSADPIVVGPAPAGEGSPHCVAAGKEVVRRIGTGRGDHYVEVHNAEFPDGALRGHLSP
ncbi:MAG: CHRD domain-containing protein [Actinobacteria bacterium]|nr:CHRD domain-containing protein [Actinomycetota bacterium]